MCESVPTSVSGIGGPFAVDLGVEDDAGQVFQVDLVHDAGIRRDDTEIIESVLSPAQERITFPVALKFDGVILRQCGRRSVFVDLHRVIDDEFRRRQRVDLFGVTTELDDGIAHRRQIDDGRDAREILHDDAAGRERNLMAGRSLRVPIGEGRDVVGRDILGAGMAQQVFEQNLQRERQPRDVPVRDGLQAVYLVVGPADGQDGFRVNCLRHGVSPFIWLVGPVCAALEAIPAETRRGIIADARCR